MEIKPQELRIGNLVYAPALKAIRVIDPLDIRDLHEGRLYQPFQGIELTPEWLKRVDWGGYKYLYFNSYFCLDEQGHLYYHGNYTGINVNYVHTLQNLYYALKGEELAIDKTSLKN